MPCAEPGPQVLQGGQRVGATLLVADCALGQRMPVLAVEKVDEVDPQCLLGLMDLPVLPAPRSFLVFAESAYLVGQRLVCCFTRQKQAYPTYAVRCGVGAHQAALEQELPEPLERRFQFAHAKACPFESKDEASGAASKGRTPPTQSIPGLGRMPPNQGEGAGETPSAYR